MNQELNKKMEKFFKDVTPEELIEKLNEARQKEGGFRKIESYKEEKQCIDHSHNPPTHIVLEPGRYEYTCPSCGNTQTVNVPQKPTL